ncbi:MAG: PKD domain-containing protein [Bacteroidia bacterium]|nr:PKD domain-containing protein [Bacteroidia bacterium]
MGTHTLKVKVNAIYRQSWLTLALSVLLHSAYSAPIASFSANNVNGCIPLSVQFTNTSTGATSYFWNLGNGNTSTLPNPTNIYSVQGNYTISLIAYDGLGGSDTATYTNYLSVNGKPNSDFYSNTLASCLDNNSYSFINTSSGATSYLWDFGDGTTTNQVNPQHSYAQSGMFTITLIATNAYGCQDIKIRNQYITIYPKPNATITASPNSSCDPATIFQLSNNVSGNNSWHWTFGDGTTSNLQNPTHTYATSGFYNVNLMVTNSNGCRDTSDTPTRISVNASNWADFNANIDSGCAPLAVTLTTWATYVTFIKWDFGDGNFSTNYNPTHTYALPGTYTVKMMIATSNGCADTITKTNLIHVVPKPTPSFTYQNSVGCGPLTVQFTNTSGNYTSCLWVFGDGSTSTDPNPVHTYTNSGTFNVTLKCWGPGGCTKSIVYYNIVKVTKTTGMFSADNRIGCPPLNVNFTNLSPPAGLSYQWNFGDGNTSTQQNPTHTYSTTGNFDVSLIVTDSLGCSDTLVKSAFIQTVNPAANYIPPPTSVGCAPLTTQFTDATAGSTAWTWDFGDGTISNLQNPVHTYTTPGFYTVSLTSTSAGGGCTQTIPIFSTFDVRGGNAGFTHNATICPPWEATFTDTSLNAVSWLWDFGDGTTSTLQNPNHTFNSPGYHSVSLTITTSDGCSYTTMQSNSVYYAPFGANFYGMPLDTVFPARVQFHANSVGATSWLWDFGDGGTSTLENPLHLYVNPLSYDVTLTISNGVCTLFYDPPPFIFGNPDTTSVDVGNFGSPVIQRGCTPLAVTFTNTIPGSSAWNWDFGDGTSSTIQFPSHTYAVPGIFTVTLTTTDTLGIVQVQRMDSIVRVSGPQAGFIVNQSSTCNNTQVMLQDTSTNAVHWQWNFGDTTLSTLQNPTHIYSSGLPNYIITQTVTDTMGCKSSISTSIFSNYVSPLIASENEICGMDTVHFYTSLQNYASYYWDFGDNTSSTLAAPSHVYTTEGVYTVNLIVTDNAGCSQSFQLNPAITVNLPVAAFVSSGTHGCDDLNVLFTNQSQNADAYLWNFGDGSTSSLTNPLHPYMDVGVFDVSLTVFRGSCVSHVDYPQYVRVDTAHAAFSWAASSICMPFNVQFTDLSANAVSWNWIFGNGDSSTVQNPSTSYIQNSGNPIRLAIVDINGCADTATTPPISPLLARFETSVDSGCVPVQVNFANNSLNGWQFHWDFGDGTTSTLGHPVHTYTVAGSYDVMLIATAHPLLGGCKDTLIIPAKIQAKEPHADFMTPDVYACAPSLVNFTDLSVDGDTYLWDFGDSTTSTNKTPSHIYNDPGIYTVSLIVQSNSGCSDTLVKPLYVQVLGPVTHFTASAFEGCAPFDVSFIDHSQNAIGWSWSFGDGYADITTNPTHTFQDTGSFTVSLVTQDTAGCSSYYELPQKILVYPTPIAEFSTPNISGCQPYTATFTNTSIGQTSALWNFGDGGTSTDINPSHVYVDNGTYPVTLIASNNFGCSDTFELSQNIQVLPTPQASFTASASQGCTPFQVTFQNTTTNLNGATFLWNFGNGTSSSDLHPTVTYSIPGFYSVSLQVINTSGCANSITSPSLIHVLDTMPPPESKIYSVSVLSNTDVEIIWENNPAIDLAAYLIHRLNPYTNQYEIIHTETNIQNTNFALESSYVDQGRNTLVNTYTYKLQALDICGNSIPLDQLTAHTTINVSSTPVDQNIRVTWTPYSGCGVSAYQIFRYEHGDTPQYLGTVPSDSLAYTDTTFDCPHPYSYRIKATDLCGTAYTSFSDTSRTYPLNTFADQVVDVIRSTVVENRSILTEWLPPVVQPDKVLQYDIYRSTDNENYSYVASVPSVQNDFMDYGADVQNAHYYYKILVINTCNIVENLSPLTSSILLKGIMNDARQVELEWNPYTGWESGVEFYVLEKLDENGHWQILKRVDGSITRYNYQE